MKYTFTGFAYPDQKPAITKSFYAKTTLAADECGRELEMDLQRINVPCFYRLVSATGRLVREEATLEAASESIRRWLMESGFCIPAIDEKSFRAMKEAYEREHPATKGLTTGLDPFAGGAAPRLDVLTERARTSGLVGDVVWGGDSFVTEEGGAQ